MTLRTELEMTFKLDSNKRHIVVNMKAIFIVMNTTWAIVKIRPEKNSGLYRMWTHNLCDSGAVLYKLSKQANWELVIMLVPNEPMKWCIDDCE